MHLELNTNYHTPGASGMAGDTITVDDQQGQQLVAAGVAREIDRVEPVPAMQDPAGIGE